MGDRSDRARAWRRAAIGGVLAALALVSTIAVAVAIPTQGENPRAWGVVVCGLVTVAFCVEIVVRNRRLLRHYRGDDLARDRRAGARPARARQARARQARAGQARARDARARQARAKAAR